MSRLSLKHLSGERIGIQQIHELSSTREVNSGTIWAKDTSILEGSQETEQISVPTPEPDNTLPQLDESEIVDDLYGLSSEEDRKVSETKRLRK